MRKPHTVAVALAFQLGSQAGDVAVDEVGAEVEEALAADGVAVAVVFDPGGVDGGDAGLGARAAWAAQDGAVAGVVVYAPVAWVWLLEVSAHTAPF